MGSGGPEFAAKSILKFMVVNSSDEDISLFSESIPIDSVEGDSIEDREINRKVQLRRLLEDRTLPEIQELLDRLDLDADVEIAVARAYPGFDEWEAGQWLARMISESRGEMSDRTGKEKRKIPETPFYRHLIEAAREKGNAKNTVGGLVYAGAPGSGKTEMATTVNDMEGFPRTWVIPIHHFTTSSDLMGESEIQVSGSGHLQGEVALIKHYRDMDHGELRQTLVNKLRSQYDDLTLQEKQALSFEQYFFQKMQYNLILKEPFGVEIIGDANKLKDGFIAFLNDDLIENKLGPEKESTWVPGPILQAMKDGQRVLLDELDQSGPYGGNSLLNLLSLSPGDVVYSGSERYVVPEGFRIDATVNEIKIDNSDQAAKTSALMSRFTAIEIGYPPLSDTLMSATFALSDGRGHIQLARQEQEQLVGFLSYLLPELRDLADTYPTFPKVSHRELNALYGQLVDPQKKERTETPIDQAFWDFLDGLIKKVEGKARSGSGQGSEKYEEINAIFRTLLRRFYAIHAKRVRGRVDNETHLIESWADSPLLHAIADLPRGMALAGDSSELVQVDLSEAQQQRLAQSPDEGDGVFAATGYSVDISPSEGGRVISLMTSTGETVISSSLFELGKSGGSRKFLQLVGDNRVLAISATGDSCLVSGGRYKEGQLEAGSGQVSGGVTNSNEFEQIWIGGLTKELPWANILSGEVQLSPDGQFCTQLDNNRLSVVGVDGQSIPLRNNVNQVEISPNGRQVLCTDLNGEHSYVYDIYSQHILSLKPDRVDPIKTIKHQLNQAYHFAGESLIAAPGSATAYLIS